MKQLLCQCRAEELTNWQNNKADVVSCRIEDLTKRHNNELNYVPCTIVELTKGHKNEAAYMSRVGKTLNLLALMQNRKFANCQNSEHKSILWEINSKIIKQ